MPVTCLSLLFIVGLCFLKAVELCLRSGAKISTQQHDLSTPVHLACSQGAMDMVKLMFTVIQLRFYGGVVCMYVGTCVSVCT